MSSFAPLPVLIPHHFEIAENGRGYWVAKDKEGLIGGVFRTQSAACSVPRRMRFVSHYLKSAVTAPTFGCFHVNPSGAEPP